MHSEWTPTEWMLRESIFFEISKQFRIQFLHISFWSDYIVFSFYAFNKLRGAISEVAEV